MEESIRRGRADDPGTRPGGDVARFRVDEGRANSAGGDGVVWPGGADRGRASPTAATVLGYADYRNFQSVIELARNSCFNSGQRAEDHFVEITEMIGIGKGGQRAVQTTMMSRYVCYLKRPGEGNGSRFWMHQFPLPRTR